MELNILHKKLYCNFLLKNLPSWMERENDCSKPFKIFSIIHQIEWVKAALFLHGLLSSIDDSPCLYENLGFYFVNFQ